MNTILAPYHFSLVKWERKPWGEHLKKKAENWWGCAERCFNLHTESTKKYNLEKIHYHQKIATISNCCLWVSLEQITLSWTLFLGHINSLSIYLQYKQRSYDRCCTIVMKILNWKNIKVCFQSSFSHRPLLRHKT